MFIFYKAHTQNLQLINQFNTKDGLLGNSISAIKKDKNGYYWLKTDNGVCRFNGRSFFNDAFPIDTTNLKKIIANQNNLVWEYGETSTGYIANSESKLFSIKYNELVKSKTRHKVIEELESLKIIKIVSDDSHYIYINNLKKTFAVYFSYQTVDGFYLITEESLAIYIDKNTKNVKNILPFNKHQNFFHIKNRLVCLDNTTGNYLVYEKAGIIKKGNIQFKGMRLNFQFFPTQINQTNHLYLIDNNLYKFYITENIEFKAELLFELTKKEKYNSIYFEDNENLLLGTYNDGIEVYATINKNIKHNSSNNVIRDNAYTHCIYNNKIINNIDFYNTYLKKTYPKWEWGLINSLFLIDGNNILYSMNGNMYLCKNKKMELFLKTTNNQKIIDYLETDSVIYLVRNSLDKYYKFKKEYKSTPISEFPSYGKTIFAICKTNIPHTIYAIIGKELKQINLLTHETKLLASGIEGYVRNIFNDTVTNTLFISTKFNGCYIYNKQLSKLPFNFNNKSLNSHYILTDKDGDYWLPTNEGLYVMFKNDYLNYLNKTSNSILFTKFGKQDGLLTEEFNGGFANAGIYFKDTMYLGSMIGTVTFNPKIKYKQKQTKGKLIFDYFKVDDSLFNENDKILINPNYKQILIKVDYPFILDNSLDFNYRLLGNNDNRWLTVPSNGIIDIKYLNAGNYTIELKLSIDKVSSKQISFKISPFWYNTWWAKLAYASIICIGGYFFLMWKFQSNKNKFLQLLNTERTNLFEIIAHDLKSPINSYIGLADDIKFLIKKKDFEGINKIGNVIDERSRNLSLLIANVINWGRSEKGLLVANKKVLLLSEVLDEILPFYFDIASFKNIAINNTINESVIIKTDKHILSHLLRNLIDNAIKHSKNNTTIKLNYIENIKECVIEISNSYDASQAEMLKQISKLLYREIKPEPHLNGLGLGIASMYQSCSLIKSKLEINLFDDIVTFKLIMPLS